ncbi:MAG: mitochondrial fission ELM1 family protein [Candidatus Omnitrophica bacterium]|nr:mitochondrial fission ELM1 family protein [Candidatus Omnitrophota bacterium]
MNRRSISDYWACIGFKIFAPIVRIFPLRFSFFLARRLGNLIYYLDSRHRAIVYANIKTVFLGKFLPHQLNKLTKKFYQHLAQSLIEIFYIPVVDKNYLSKYIELQGLEHIKEAFKNGKGVILLSVHAGSWELSNIISANLGFSFSLFIRDQRHPRLNHLLNSYRLRQGCKIIQKGNQIRALIKALRNNEAVGMTADQGGKGGILVKFFGRNASMPSGAVRLALKYGASLIPVFYIRQNGPYIKVIIQPPFPLQRTQGLDANIRNNLQEIVHIFEQYILQYPQEYLWTYKVWKYSDEKNILILDDGKAGHTRQAEALANIIQDYFKDKDILTNINMVEVKFKNRFNQRLLALGSSLAGKYCSQGCLFCLRAALTKEVYNSLIASRPDVIISAGSSLASINYLLSRENLAKSIVIMQPSLLALEKFDLVIMPQHDRPPKRKNVVVTQGALNLISQEYLQKQTEELLRTTHGALRTMDFYIGLLIGGDSKKFHLDKDIILEVIRQMKSVGEKYSADILVTTSRRTCLEVEDLVKREFKDYPRCKLLVIANEENPPFTVGGILGLSKIIVTSPESISMISEAVNSKKYVIVFEVPGLSKKHQRFLKQSTGSKHLYLTEAADLSKKFSELLTNRPEIKSFQDNLLVREAISRIL